MYDFVPQRQTSTKYIHVQKTWQKLHNLRLCGSLVLMFWVQKLIRASTVSKNVYMIRALYLYGVMLCGIVSVGSGNPDCTFISQTSFEISFPNHVPSY